LEKRVLREEIGVRGRTDCRILREVGAGAKVVETCRKYGISEPTFYAWRAKYGGMDVNELRRLKELEDENAKLKRMYAELALVHNALQDVVDRKP